MVSRQTTVDFALDQMARAGEVTARKMFGEYGVYCGDKFVAVICNDQLFVKPTTGGRALAPDAALVPAYPGAKPSLLIAAERWEDADWLSALISVTAAELPQPKPKSSKRPR